MPKFPCLYHLKLLENQRFFSGSIKESTSLRYVKVSNSFHQLSYFKNVFDFIHKPSSNIRFLNKCRKEWNNLDPHIKKSKSISIFKSNILKFMRPKPNKVYYCHNPKEIILFKRLRLGLSHLCEHKFKHSFHNCLNIPIFFTSTVMKLKHLPTTYFTVLPIQTKE